MPWKWPSVFPVDFLSERGFAVKELKWIACNRRDRHWFSQMSENTGRNCPRIRAVPELVFACQVGAEAIA